MNDSRIPGFYRLSVAERIDVLNRQGWLSDEDAGRLRRGQQVLSSAASDRIIENVVGVFGLPLAIAPNFCINDDDCLIPLVVEEPSIVAALSGAARLARATGGFNASCTESLLAGQVHVTDVANPREAVAALEAAKSDLIDAANDVHPRLIDRGGGVRDVEVRALEFADGAPFVAVHLLVDTVDAMGANLVNTICESLAPAIGEACGGTVALRILSNLADRSIARANVRYGVNKLGVDDIAGADVRDAIVVASDIARADPHRAVTHNKGIMNGIDAVAIATGNDWRAIEAGAHAYAARDGQYRSLARWSIDDAGDLLGEIELPLKIGTVGGTLDANPAARLGLAIAGTVRAAELAQHMAAVGLAQNFAALRALASSGIQRGHMKLHARSLAAAAGAPDEHFDAVVDRIVASGDIKSHTARKIVSQVAAAPIDESVMTSTAAGKVILLGEHAAVYGRHALALPIDDAVRAGARPDSNRTTVTIRDWDVDGTAVLDEAASLIKSELGVGPDHFAVLVDTTLPRAMGLGSSAALAVGITRAIAAAANLTVSDERVNEIAFACEKLAHGTPSGVDNTISTYRRPMLFRNDGALEISSLELSETPPIVIASSGVTGLTSEQVNAVRERRRRAPQHFDAVFDEIDSLSLKGAELLEAAEYEELGLLMNICHGMLSAIGVSTAELEQMIAMARDAGAAGAKLTGAGGGGSIVALCPHGVAVVRDALQRAGYRTLVLEP